MGSSSENSWPAVFTAWWRPWRSANRSWWGSSARSRTTNSNELARSSAATATSWRPPWRWWSQLSAPWRSRTCLPLSRWVVVVTQVTAETMLAPLFLLCERLWLTLAELINIKPAISSLRNPDLISWERFLVPWLESS